MSQIKFTSMLNNNTVEFGSLVTGDTFMYNETPCIKTTIVFDCDQNPQNALFLETGFLFCLNKTDRVIPIFISSTIEKGH